MPKSKKSEPSPNESRAMKASAIDFLLKDIELLKQFIKKMQDDFGETNLIFTLKMFVLNANKAFNMAEYMKGQSRLAEEYIKSLNKDFNPEERRQILNNWIETNAAQYRKQIVFEQISFINKMSAEVVPVIKKALKK